MKIVFFGSSNFAVESLKALLGSKHEVLYVITQPDREKGRGMHLGKTPVKIFAEEKGLKVFQPYRKDLNDEIDFLRKFNADIFVVVAYGLILPKAIIDLPKIFSINLHGSLLPNYRGAAPINRAIINGDTETGTTVIKLIVEMDAGPVISSKKVNIKETDNAHTLEEKLAISGAELLLETLNDIQASDYKLLEQDKTKVTLAPKLLKQTGLIDWEDSAVNISNLIRGCFGWPGAFTYYRGKMIKILQAEYDKSTVSDYLSGQIYEIGKDGIRVKTGNGSVVIKQLQPEGKNVMSCADFISGHKITKGDILTSKK
ncbi:MAG: methionyl-tRNA formyltransferase [Candidatus Omnitrophica bacterium]|nr:methionyl-tRNA formyltransferase [Candidatus Omnitrophota bacterium]